MAAAPAECVECCTGAQAAARRPPTTSSLYRMCQLPGRTDMSIDSFLARRFPPNTHTHHRPTAIPFTGLLPPPPPRLLSPSCGWPMLTRHTVLQRACGGTLTALQALPVWQSDLSSAEEKSRDRQHPSHIAIPEAGHTTPRQVRCRSTLCCSRICTLRVRCSTLYINEKWSVQCCLRDKLA